MIGNLKGLAPAERRRLEKLRTRRLPPRSIVSQEFARELAELSAATRRRLGVLVDRAGRVERVAIGDAHRVEVPRKPSAPSGRMRFCTLRFLTTRFDDRSLDEEALAPLALHRLDALASISVGENGLPGDVRVAHLIPAPVREDETPATLVREDETPRKARGRTGARKKVEVRDVLADGERYRLFPPQPASRLEDDFLELIRALEQEFDRHYRRMRTAEDRERAILVHVTTGRRAEAVASMTELEELADSSDLAVVERIIQRRSKFDPKTLMGAGKLQDLIIQALPEYTGIFRGLADQLKSRARNR